MMSRSCGLRKPRGKIRTSCPPLELSQPAPEIPVNWSGPRKRRSECWKSILRSECPDWPITYRCAAPTIWLDMRKACDTPDCRNSHAPATRSEEHKSEIQSRENLVCRLL